MPGGILVVTTRAGHVVGGEWYQGAASALTVHRAFILTLDADGAAPEKLWSTTLLEPGMNWVSI